MSRSSDKRSRPFSVATRPVKRYHEALRLWATRSFKTFALCERCSGTPLCLCQSWYVGCYNVVTLVVKPLLDDDVREFVFSIRPKPSAPLSLSSIKNVDSCHCEVALKYLINPLAMAATSFQPISCEWTTGASPKRTSTFSRLY